MNYDYDDDPYEQRPPQPRGDYPRDWRWRIALVVVALGAGSAIVWMWA